jgi:hypothetical protein
MLSLRKIFSYRVLNGKNIVAEIAEIQLIWTDLNEKN